MKKIRTIKTVTTNYAVIYELPLSLREIKEAAEEVRVDWTVAQEGNTSRETPVFERDVMVATNEANLTFTFSSTAVISDTIVTRE